MRSIFSFIAKSLSLFFHHRPENFEGKSIHICIIKSNVFESHRTHDVPSKSLKKWQVEGKTIHCVYRKIK